MNTQTTIAGVTFKNPVMTASGTFGSGMEYEEFVDLNRLGAVVTKGVANVPWPGNPTPRVAEVYGGMLNAVFSEHVTDNTEGSAINIIRKKNMVSRIQQRKYSHICSLSAGKCKCLDSTLKDCHGTL